VIESRNGEAIYWFVSPVDPMEGWHLRQTSELSFTSTSSEDTISESVVQRRSSIGHGSLRSWSLQSSTLTSVSEYVPLQAQNS